MPRLVGERSHYSLYTGVILAIAIGVAGAVEYFGIVNVVPGFGRESFEPVSQNTELLGVVSIDAHTLDQGEQ